MQYGSSSRWPLLRRLRVSEPAGGRERNPRTHGHEWRVGYDGVVGHGQRGPADERYGGRRGRRHVGLHRAHGEHLGRHDRLRKRDGVRGRFRLEFGDDVWFLGWRRGS